MKRTITVTGTFHSRFTRLGVRSLSQTYAIKSQSFALHTTATISEEGISKLRTSSGVTMNTPGGGSSAIFGPDGRLLAEGPAGIEEGFVYA